MVRKCWFALAVFLFALLLGVRGQNEALKIVFVSGANEYSSSLSLEKYKKYLERNHEGVQITCLQADGALNKYGEFSDLPGLAALAESDVALLFTRRLTIDGEQLERVKKYVNSGKPIVALRTASHGFQNWLEFDKLVLGGNYHKHYPEGPIQQVRGVPVAKNHPVLAGIVDFTSRYSLYVSSPVAPDVSVLMTGTIPGEEPEPVVWTRTYQGARVCYIALGGLQDFENLPFKQLLTNAIFWAAGREVKRVGLPAEQNTKPPKELRKLG